LPSVTDSFTWCVTNPAAYRGKGIGSPDKHVCILKTALTNMLQISEHISVNGAGIDTGCFAWTILALIYGRLVGYGLRKRYVCCLSWTCTHVEFTLHDHRAPCRAGTAGCTLFRINIACFFEDGNLETCTFFLYRKGFCP